MTFVQLIKILDLLDHDKEILIKKERPDESDYVDKFSKGGIENDKRRTYKRLFSE